MTTVTNDENKVDVDVTMTDTTTMTTTTMTEPTSPSTSVTSKPPAFRNASLTGEIPSYNGNAEAQATDFANYFCSYAQLYHQKQMLADHNRMAAYHAAILGNANLFQDKVVMDVGTGSGILAVWAAQAGARKVYAIEYTNMAKHAQKVMEANNVSDVVTVIQAAVETVELPIEQDQLELELDDNNDDDNNDHDDKNKNNNKQRCVDIIISEWMGYFLLRESMLDSLIRARNRFLKQKTGIMLPSHVEMYIAPIVDEEERKASHTEYANAMSDWRDFCHTTQTVYGVDMTVLNQDFDVEQKEYYLLSSRWTELSSQAILAEPKVIQTFDLMTCTLDHARGIPANNEQATFCFDMNGSRLAGPVSGLAGWFVAEFKTRTDALFLSTMSSSSYDTTTKNNNMLLPILHHPTELSTSPDQGYTHWGQQTFYFVSSIPLLQGESTRLEGRLELIRTQDNARLYNCRITYTASRRKLITTTTPTTTTTTTANTTTTSTTTTTNSMATTQQEQSQDNKDKPVLLGTDRSVTEQALLPDDVGPVLMKSGPVTRIYQIP